MNVLPGRFDDDHAVVAMTAENGGLAPSDTQSGGWDDPEAVAPRHRAWRRWSPAGRG